MFERQLIFDCIDLFSNNKKSKFYEKVFDTIDLSCFPEYPESMRGPKGYSFHALFRAFIIMKCEKQRHITQLVEFLDNNRYLAYLCGFDVFKDLPSYSVFQRFIRNIDNEQIKSLMKNQVLSLKKLGFIDNSFVSLDSTPVFANTKHNNPKSFSKNRFKKDNQPKSDRDCTLGVHTASNSHNEKKYEFYWGYKNHVLVDSISGLPIFEFTSPANTSDSEATIPLLKNVNSWFSLGETYFIADKGYDTKAIHNFVRDDLLGHAFIPLNPRGKKGKKLLPAGNVICDAGLAMHKDGRQYFSDRIKQKFCCPFRTSKDDEACPFSHVHYFNGKKNRGCTRYITTGTDYRASINRESKFFKSIYTLRTESERYNSRWKNLALEKPSARNISSISNLNTIGHICLLSIALAAIKDNSIDSTKSLSKLMKKAA